MSDSEKEERKNEKPFPKDSQIPGEEEEDAQNKENERGNRQNLLPQIIFFQSYISRSRRTLMNLCSSSDRTLPFLHIKPE